MLGTSLWPQQRFFQETVAVQVRARRSKAACSILHHSGLHLLPGNSGNEPRHHGAAGSVKKGQETSESFLAFLEEMRDFWVDDPDFQRKHGRTHDVRWVWVKLDTPKEANQVTKQTASTRWKGQWLLRATLKQHHRHAFPRSISAKIYKY